MLMRNTLPSMFLLPFPEVVPKNDNSLFFDPPDLRTIFNILQSMWKLSLGITLVKVFCFHPPSGFCSPLSCPIPA